ncbi:MAG: BACON domain-containing carbohydrate-binding protein [Bryobacteraceae bacterium]
MRGGDILLGASLTMKAGEYAVTLSAVDESGEERAAAANVTVEALPPVPTGGSTPPVVLLNGWQFSVLPPSTCPISPTGSVATFGSLASQLVAPQVYFFDNCVEQSVNGSTIEELGVTLGQFLNMIEYAGGALVPQVDLVSHSMGGLIVRSYLAGLQANDGLSPVLNPRVRKFIEIATPNFGSFLAANYSDAFASGTQAAEMVPGSGFLWTLGTWNQRGDDLRGVDALAIIGNAGYWKSSIFSLTQLNNATDGVVSFTSASLNFARDPSRTRILPYCHIDSASAAGAFIDCTGKGIADVDEAPETGVIILSFLANTTAWQSVGYPNQTQYGGAYFALENAAGTQYTPFSSVTWGTVPFGSGWLDTIFYNEFISGSATFSAISTANQTTTCGPFTASGGYFSAFRCKFSPVILSVVPLLPNAPGWVVKSGGGITISGVGFGSQCSTCQVLAYPGPSPLSVSSWSDQTITAFLPATYNGIAEVVVQIASGSDALTFMAAPASSVAVAPTSLQFAYTVGGTVPAAQSIQITNSGGGALNWSATTSATWLSVAAASGTAPSTLSVLVSPTGIGAGTYTGSVQISATGASNSPVSVAVTLTVALAPPVLTISPQALAFNYTVGGTIPAAQSIQVTNSGGGMLNWSATTSATWLSVAVTSGTAPSTLSVLVSPTGLGGGTYTGSVQISAAGASNSPASVAVTLTVAPAPPVLAVSPQALTFNYAVGGRIPAAQGISITNTGGGALSWVASASAAWVGLSPASGTAPATLSVSANPATLAAGSYSATVLITAAGATASPASVSVTLVVQAPSITGVTNGASFQAGFASATWVSIFGTNLSQTTRPWQNSDFVNGLLPTSLSGVSVTINGLAAYVEYISPTQVNVLAPDDATVGAVEVQVTAGQVKSNSFTAQKEQFAPAFFTMGGNYAAAEHADYTLVGEPGLIAGAITTPAKPGEIILIYGTGFGPTSPPLPSAQLVTTPAVLANSVQVTIGGVSAPWIFAGLAGSGLCQFNVTVPNVPNGDAAVVAQIGGVQTQTGVLITIQQ